MKTNLLGQGIEKNLSMNDFSIIGLLFSNILKHFQCLLSAVPILLGCMRSCSLFSWKVSAIYYYDYLSFQKTKSMPYVKPATLGLYTEWLGVQKSFILKYHPVIKSSQKGIFIQV